MKPLVQHLPLPPGSSFLVKTYVTFDVELQWHKHAAYELIVFTQGEGLASIGSEVSEFAAGDSYFLGSHLPHAFETRPAGPAVRALIIQFQKDFLGSRFLELPECRSLRQLLEESRHGLKLTGKSKQKVQELAGSLATASGLKRLLTLTACLEIMAEGREYVKVCTQVVVKQRRRKDTMEAVFEFTQKSFQQAIRIAQVAEIVGMTEPAFCLFFKSRTQKTYIDYLNEVRIGYACQKLLETSRPVLEICYASGYTTLSNFHKQFIRIKKVTPLQYRKQYTKQTAEHEYY